MNSNGISTADQNRALAASTLSFTVCFAVWTIFSIIGIRIKSELGLSDTQFGILVATPILTGSISRIFLGIWTDQYGGRIVYTLQMLLTAFAAYLLTLVTTYEMFLVAALGVGLAGGSFAVGVAYVAKWYPKERQGTALGIFGMGNVGAAVTNFGAPFLLILVGGQWQGVAQIYAVVMAIAAVLFFLFTKEDPDVAARKKAGQKHTSFLAQLDPLKNLQVWRFSLYYFFVFGAFVALALWLPRYYVGAYGLDLKTAGLLAAAYALPGSVFRALGGWISDKLGARTVMYWTFIASVACTFILSYPSTDYTVAGIDGPISFNITIPLWLFVGLTIILGFFMSLGKAAVYKHIPTYYPGHVGSVGGIVGLIGGLGGFVLPISFGFMNDVTGVWTSCFMLLTILIGIALTWMHFTVRRLEGKRVPELRRPHDLPEFESLRDLRGWNPDDPVQWATDGKSIATRNLWISIPALLCGFAVWLYWGIISVQMMNLGFPFTQSQLFTLTAIAGLSGATLRIPSSFFIRIGGGRYTTFFTTVLLIIPALGAGILLQDINSPLWQFQLMALLSGLGGGNFASSMSNISFFYPKKIQGYALGMNAGIGNFGVTTMQILVPLVMTFAMFGGEPMVLQASSGTLIGKIPAGTETYIQNAGFVWLIFLIPLAVVVWFGMNNIRDEHVSPDASSAFGSFLKIGGMLLVGLVTSVFGLWLLLPSDAGGSGLELSKWLVLPIVIVLTLMLLRLIPGTIQTNLKRQFKIFRNKHTWAMTVIYTMTFGSFIGFSAALPLAIKVIFGFQHGMVDGVMTHDVANPNGPSALTYAWMGPFIGALIRPVGGKLADRFGGALVTQIISVVMVLSALGVAYFMSAAYGSMTPEAYFFPFLILFLVLFAATGIGNGSTFRTIAIVFDKEQAGPVLGWTSAIAAYGAFIIPQVFGEQIKLTTPEYALYGFAVFYGVCIAINWWFYLRKNAYVMNP